MSAKLAEALREIKACAGNPELVWAKASLALAKHEAEKQEPDKAAIEIGAQALATDHSGGWNALTELEKNRLRQDASDVLCAVDWLYQDKVRAVGIPAVWADPRDLDEQQTSFLVCNDSQKQCSTNKLRFTVPLYTSPQQEPDRLELVKSAVTDYYAALDRREHGGVAQDRAFNKIEQAMGMCWVQGASLDAAKEAK